MLPLVTLLVALCLSVVQSDCDVSHLDSSKPEDYCLFKISNGTLKKGDSCIALPEDLSPTQAAFGEVDAGCERRNLENLASTSAASLKAYLWDHQVPAVVGPGSRIYLTDHHHLSHALLTAFLDFTEPLAVEYRVLPVCIIDELPMQGFWEQMKAKAYVWLHDFQGNNITVQQLPTSVKYLLDDPYRTLAEWSRDSFGFVKCGKKDADKHFPQCKKGAVAAKPFIEFRWANIYRDQFPLDSIYVESDQKQAAALQGVLKDVIHFSLGKANDAVEGWNQLQYTDMVSIDKYGCSGDSRSQEIAV